jgi:hypothetical protein
VLALVMVVGFGYWSYVLIESGTWWWALATGLGALVAWWAWWMNSKGRMKRLSRRKLLLLLSPRKS